MRRLPAFGLVALAALLMLPSASADARFTVSPTLIEIERAPGRSATGSIEVELRNQPGRFEVLVQDAIQQPDGTFAFREATGSAFSASSWVTAEPRRFSGRPNRTQPVDFDVRVPRGAEPGDHVTALLIRTTPEEDEVAVAAEAVAVRLTISVEGRGRPSAEIVSLDSPSVAGDSPVAITAAIRNTGNVRLDFSEEGNAEGGLSVLAGDEVRARADAPAPVYPGQTGVLELAWDDPPLLGQFRAVATVDVGEEQISSSDTFFVFPWRQVGALLLLTLAVVVLLAGRYRRR